MPIYRKNCVPVGKFQLMLFMLYIATYVYIYYTLSRRVTEHYKAPDNFSSTAVCICAADGRPDTDVIINKRL